MRMRGPWPEAAERSHIDDAAAALFQVRESLTRDEKWAAGIGGKDRVPLLDGELGEFHGGVVGGIIDEHVNGAELADYFVYHLANAQLVGHVAAQGECVRAALGNLFDDLAGLGLDSRKVMATVAPWSAAARAMARPSLFAAPVTRTIFPDRGAGLSITLFFMGDFFVIHGFYLKGAPRRSSECGARRTPVRARRFQAGGRLLNFLFTTEGMFGGAA